MRKMNKIVALSLVLAMALSMMASAASFKDQATINEDLMDEINLLVNLGVYSENGTGAGYFEPNMVITRAQAAKMIYVLKNKGVDNGATSWTGLNIFTDVEAGSWLEGYVNYCASTGIMVGGGDGKFNPNDELTGVQLAKMLLVVIGYKADVEGYTGDKWDANILADAESAGFFVDYEMPVNGKVTREWAALMIANAINATKVRYADGELVEMYNDDNEPITYAAQDLGLVETVGMLVSTPNIELGNPGDNEDGKNKHSSIQRFNADGTTNGAPVKFEYDANPELLGQMVTVLTKGALSVNAKIYGVTAHEDVVVVDTTVDAISISEIAGNNNEVSVEINGETKKYNVENNANKDAIDVYTNYVLTGNNYRIAANPNTGSYAKINLGGVVAGSNDGRPVKLIDNDGDGKFDVVFANTVKYDRVEYINPANHIIRFTEDSTLDITGGTAEAREEAWADVNFVDSVVEDDVVKVTYDYSTGKEIRVIEKMDVVTGAVTKKSGSTYTIDGGSYKLAAAAISGTSVAVTSTAKNYFVDGKYVVFTDVISDNEMKNTNVAYVIKAGTGKDAFGENVNRVDILKNDGERVTLEYADNDSYDGYRAFGDIAEGKLYEYVMKNGKVYFKLITGTDAFGFGAKGLAGTEENSGKEFDKSAGKFFVKVASTETTFLVNDETYFFVIDDANGNYAVATAAEIKGDMNWMSGTRLAASESGLPYLYFAVLSGEVPGMESSTGTAITANAQTEELDEEGEKIYKLVATKLDGTEVTLVSEESLASYTNQFVSYKIDTDGMLAEVDGIAKKAFAASYHHVAVTEIADKGIMVSETGLDNADFYVDLDDEVKIYYVDAFETTSGTDRIIVSEGNGIVISDELNESAGVATYAQSALVKIEDDEIKEIIIEIQGEEIDNTGNQFFTIAP